MGAIAGTDMCWGDRSFLRAMDWSTEFCMKKNNPQASFEIYNDR